MQQTRHVSYILLLSFTMLALASCGAPKESKTAIIRIVSKSKNEKVGTLGLNIPVGKTPCFGISISASDIPGEPAKTCSPATGIVRGFVKFNEAMEAEVPYGSGRVLSIYMLLLNNATDPCPAMPAVFPASKLNEVYYVGGNAGFNIDAPEVVVEAELNFDTSTSQSLGATYPSSCTAVAGGATSNPHQFFVGSGGGISSSGSYSLKGRVGRVGSGPILSGGSYNLKVK